MTEIDILRRYGLFDTKVPRYTSYPPANRFKADVGQRHQAEWLGAVPDNGDISVYIHIPFCKKACWFCACRTQGTRQVQPLEDYVDNLLVEIAATRRLLPNGVRMARLHLGGGTPTILTAPCMARLIGGVFAAFAKSATFEFSVEIDPTDAPADTLRTLVDHGLTRASIGVQDVSPAVQRAIGRTQTLAQTQETVGILRAAGVPGIDIDLLYGLPQQTAQSFQQILHHVCALDPDRLAINEYAHVPWLAKRQMMIAEHDLPDAETRFALAQGAKTHLQALGFREIGLDHFARQTDPLCKASDHGLLRRTFQGYTDDQSTTLVGFGASAVSQFSQGYVQNTTATSAWADRVAHSGLAGHAGHKLTSEDRVASRMINDLMCQFTLSLDALHALFPDHGALLRRTERMLLTRFPDAFSAHACRLSMVAEARPLVRVIAHQIDFLIKRSKATHGFGAGSQRITGGFRSSAVQRRYRRA